MPLITNAYYMIATLLITTFTQGVMVSGILASEPYADPEIILSFDEVRTQLQRYGNQIAPTTPEGSFRLTTYNIENLFDAHDDPTLTGRDDDAEGTKPEHELIATAMAIHAVNADVICFQEIESESALLEYRDRYLADMGYDHFVSIDAGNSRGIENAVLSRFPISGAKNWPNKELGGVHPEKYGTKKNWYAGEPIAFRRSPLMVDLQIPGGVDQPSWTLTLIVLHHKSGRFNAYWREAEARGTLDIINGILESDPSRPIVVLGDFNADIGADSVQVYLDAGFVDVFEGSGENSKTVTHESGRRIDLVLGNKSAINRMNTGAAFVYGTASRPDGTNWRDLETFEGYASDHYPVSVDMKH